MNSTEHLAIIKRMGPKDDIIDHMHTIPDLLLPAGDQ